MNIIVVILSRREPKPSYQVLALSWGDTEAKLQGDKGHFA